MSVYTQNQCLRYNISNASTADNRYSYLEDIQDDSFDKAHIALAAACHVGKRGEEEDGFSRIHHR